MSAPVNLKQFEATGSHLEVGVAIGRRFAGQINRALKPTVYSRSRFCPIIAPRRDRRDTNNSWIHQVRFPDYLEELEGLAPGAGRPFEDLFLTNMRGEYQTFLQRSDVRGCSDCVLSSWLRQTQKSSGFHRPQVSRQHFNSALD
jgi:hypothetical protein